MLALQNISQGTGTAFFNFGGGTMQANGPFTTTLPMALTAIGGNANVNTAGFAVTLSGILSGSGGLNKLGTGTLTLNAVNSFTGSTAVAAGTLALGSTGLLASTLIDVGGGATFDVSAKGGGFAVGTSETLKGSGTVVGNLTIYGIHAPGSSPGIELVQGNYNMLGQLDIELMGTTAGTGYDQVLLPLNGSAIYNTTLGGTLALDWTSVNGSTATTKLWILENDTTGTLSGTFGNYVNGADLGNHDGREWYLWYGADAATGNLAGGNDVVITPVPEPSTLIPLGMGAMVCCGWSRRRVFRKSVTILPALATFVATSQGAIAASSYQFVKSFGSFGSGNGQFVGPYGVALDHSGNIFVTDCANNRVEKFNGSGGYLTQFGNGQFHQPDGVARTRQEMSLSLIVTTIAFWNSPAAERISGSLAALVAGMGSLAARQDWPWISREMSL